jgi:Protein of unknown function (DUF1488).
MTGTSMALSPHPVTYSKGDEMMQAHTVDQVIYDADRHILRFCTRDGDIEIACAVSKAALVALEDDASAGPHAMTVTYQRNKKKIQAVAIRKYREHCFEDDDMSWFGGRPG